jgi:hypothetical protein
VPHHPPNENRRQLLQRRERLELHGEPCLFLLFAQLTLVSAVEAGL